MAQGQAAFVKTKTGLDAPGKKEAALEEDPSIRFAFAFTYAGRKRHCHFCIGLFKLSNLCSFFSGITVATRAIGAVPQSYVSPKLNLKLILKTNLKLILKLEFTLGFLKAIVWPTAWL